MKHSALTCIAIKRITGKHRSPVPFLSLPDMSFCLFHSNHSCMRSTYYGFMSLATRFVARVFTGGGQKRLVRWFLALLTLPFPHDPVPGFERQENDISRPGSTCSPGCALGRPPQRATPAP